MQVKKDLLEYIENEIFPLYDRNEKSHGIEHIKTVIERSFEIAINYDVDANIVYTVAAYHDLGHYIDRKTHEIISANIFMEDEHIKKWFRAEEVKTIKEAIEDHRASSNHEPRSIYGMIVSTADRTIIDIDDTIKRAYFYGKKNSPEKTEQEQIERVYEHLSKKYGENGYAKLYLKDEKLETALQNLRTALSDKESFIKRVKQITNKLGEEKNELF